MESRKVLIENQEGIMFQGILVSYLKLGFEIVHDSCNSVDGRRVLLIKKEERMYTLEEMKKAFYRGKMHLYQGEENAFDEFLKTL